MAAPLLGRNFTNFGKFRCFSASSVASSNAVATQESRVVQYPPVKPRYPPGKWGNLSEKTAWRFDTVGNEMLAIPRIKERLEKFAGEKQKILYLVEPLDKRPKNLQFRQWMTKTHIASGLPEVYKDSDTDVDSAYDRLKSSVADSIDLELEYQDRTRLETDAKDPVAIDKDWLVGHRVLGRVMNAFSSKLAADNRYLLHSQVDEDVRVESFWYAGNFQGKDNPMKGRWTLITKDKTEIRMALFQYRHKADWQIRIEDPLPTFVSMDNPVCRDGPVPQPNYTPLAAGVSHIWNRPISVSGHWIGDPCEFSLLSLNLLPIDSYNILAELGHKHALEAQFSFGMTSAFGSCVAQAHNQGFSYLHDLTYPLTTQCLVTDGKHIRLFAYQLNTMRLWLEDGPSGNPLRNIVWATDPIPLFDGNSRRPNAEAFKLLLKCLLLKPSVVDSETLRPFLPEENRPSECTAYINRKGEEPLPYVKIERFQYPRNAVYF